MKDVLLTADLERYCRDHMVEGCRGVWETEQKITKILWKIEHRGMRLDIQRLVVMSNQTEILLSNLQQEISEMLIAAGCRYKSIRPGENDDCYNVLCAHFGLPVLEWTAGGKGGKNKKPSFNKSALKAYLHHPAVLESDVLQGIITRILKFRKWDIINNMFLTPYKSLHIQGLLHGDFNQSIRTARMSMSRPNMQQVPPEVRRLIIPFDQDFEYQMEYMTKNAAEPGMGLTAAGIESEECIVGRDASQIEFRLITHYTRNKAALKAYNENPETDYHQYIAERNGIPRGPAKNINFMLSFGGGKYKTLGMLKDCLDLLGSYDAAAQRKHEGRQLVVPAVVWKGRVIQKELRLQGFDAFCWVQATKTYEGYHRKFPELKKVSWKAQELIQDRGWVKNLYGRVRTMPVWAANKAFNNLVQSSAADYLKERVVALDEQYPDLKIVSLVHDEIVTSETHEQLQDEELQDGIMKLLCTPSIKLDVPVYWGKAVGSRNWGEAK